MFTGIFHQVVELGKITGVSVVVLAALGALVWLDPKTLRFALVAGAMVLITYFSVLYGDHLGIVDGKAEVQQKWDKAKKAAAAARAAEIERQVKAAAEQRSRDEEAAAELASQQKADEAAINGASPKDDGPVPKVLLDSWTRERASRGRQ
jgi:hypothetical protein